MDFRFSSQRRFLLFLTMLHYGCKALHDNVFTYTLTLVAAVFFANNIQLEPRETFRSSHRSIWPLRIHAVNMHRRRIFCRIQHFRIHGGGGGYLLNSVLGSVHPRSILSNLNVGCCKNLVISRFPESFS